MEEQDYGKMTSDKLSLGKALKAEKAYRKATSGDTELVKRRRRTMAVALSSMTGGAGAGLTGGYGLSKLTQSQKGKALLMGFGTAAGIIGGTAAGAKYNNKSNERWARETGRIK